MFERDLVAAGVVLSRVLNATEFALLDGGETGSPIDNSPINCLRDGSSRSVSWSLDSSGLLGDLTIGVGLASGWIGICCGGPCWCCWNICCCCT